MEEDARTEYPAMLANLRPSDAVGVLQERSKRINKLNLEVADWLQERRKVEEQYVAGLRRLLQFKGGPNPASELGVFQGPWDRVLQAADAIAASHHLYAQRIERDLESALRGFHGRKEVGSLNTMSGNLVSMARELDEAQEKSDKAARKSGKGAAQKADAAAAKLNSATQQWESQAPFIFETLQSVDELRINHLRDMLTQLQTHEVDQATRTQGAAEDALNIMLEISTAQEILSFANRATVGKPKVERRAPTRQSSITPSSSLAPPPSAGGHEDNASEHSGKNEQAPKSTLSRIGTMLGRRRQSIHGGFGQISPAKGSSAFGRLGSSHGRAISPRASSHNLAESNRLSSLAETPDTPPLPASNEKAPQSHEGTNGVGGDAAGEPGTLSQAGVNGRLLTAEEIFDAPADSATQEKATTAEPQKDAEGFTVPPAMNDPISQAQKDAGVLSEEGDQLFKLDIKNEPVAEEDAVAKQAALANVANSLSMSMPSRKGGTVRGRRDVRNTIYVPPPVSESAPSEGVMPVPSPALPTQLSKPSAVAALASEASIAGTSDTQSVRSATSLGTMVQFKHPDMHGPGLNSSIIESVSASFEGDELKAVKVSGEIAFSYNSTADTPAKDTEMIRINNFSALEAIGPNRIFVQHTASPDEFTIDTSHIPKTSIGFTYRAHADTPTSLAPHLPLQLSVTWKPIGDKLGLVIQYRRFPTSSTAENEKLHNLVVVATYDGARASGAQTKPSGTHLKDKHLVYWRLGDVAPGKDWSKIICRIIGDQGAEPKPGHVEVRWERVVASDDGRGAGMGISVSRLVEDKGKGKGKVTEGDDEEDDPFADEDNAGAAAARRALEGLPPVDREWVEVPLVKKIVSGRYEAKGATA